MNLTKELKVNDYVTIFQKNGTFRIIETKSRALTLTEGDSPVMHECKVIAEDGSIPNVWISTQYCEKVEQ